MASLRYSRMRLIVGALSVRYSRMYLIACADKVVMCICARSWVILFHERWCAAALRQVHNGLLWTFCSSMFHRYL